MFLSAEAPGEETPLFLLNKKDKEVALISCSTLSNETLKCEVTKLLFQNSFGQDYPTGLNDKFWNDYLSTSSPDFKEIFEENGEVRAEYIIKHCSDINDMRVVMEAMNGSSLAKQKLNSLGGSQDQFKKFMEKDRREIDYFKKRVNAMVLMCDKPSVENFKRLALVEFEIERATCTPLVTRQTLSFLKRSKDLWYQTIEPLADDKCEAITRRTISRPDNSTFDWSYSEKMKSLLIDDHDNDCTSIDKEKLYIRTFSPSFFGCDYVQ